MASGVVLLALVAVALAQYLRPIPALAATPALPSSIRVAGAPPALPWPTVGAAAVAVPGLGLLGSDGTQPLPTASMAKVMTAYLVLERHPLKLGEQGPLVTVQPQDVATYQADYAQGQSVVQVQAGEQLSEWQLLEGLLIPSGNNLADLLGRWEAGSVAAMVGLANQTAAQLGMSKTHFADLSGFDPGTVSTPADLITLAEAAMANPVFAALVAMPVAQLPVAGTVYNVDAALGRHGIVGIKTGSDVPAGACFLFASRQVVSGRPVTILGAVMGEPTLAAAFQEAESLAAAVAGGLKLTHVLSANQTVGSYSAPWGARTDILASSSLDFWSWPGDIVRTRLEAPSVRAPLAAGAKVGDLVVDLRQRQIRVPVVTAGPLYAPGKRWRLTRTTL